MTRARLLVTLLVFGVAGCSNAAYVSPNDPQ
jgi:hypothetical protein